MSPCNGHHVGHHLSPDITLTLSVVTQRIFGGLDSTSIMAIAFFVLAGNIATKGGISRRLVEFANCIVGGFRGGMSLAMVLACTFCRIIRLRSGNGGGDWSHAVSGYGASGIFEKERTAGLLVVAGGLGPIIPPIYYHGGLLYHHRRVRGKMFSAGMGIGFMIVAVLMATIIFMPTKKSGPKLLKS